jgi:hypothetical protein
VSSTTWNGASGDWTDAADWQGGAVPTASTTATFSGTGGYTVTLYTAAAAAGVTMNAPGSLFYDAGMLALGGVFALEAGTFALAYGGLQGGTLALDGGTLLAEGGTLSGVAVQGTLGLTQANATLEVQNGLTMAGSGGTGSGTIAVTGNYAALDFLGSQMLANAVVTLGATGPGQDQGGAASIGVSHAYNATAGATLTLAANVWAKEVGTQGQIIVGSGLPSAYTDEVLNQGTITNAVNGGTLTLMGPGLFDNAGVIGVSNNATLDIATGSFVNTGAIVVTDATLDLGGSFSATLLSALGPLTLSSGTLEIGGDALNAGNTLAIGTATADGPILLDGTITGGTVSDAGGGLTMSGGTGVLDAVAYQGTLAVGAGDALTLADSTSLATASGAGSASITGAGASLLLECLTQAQTTLNNATISLGSSSGVAALGTTDEWLASAATTATLGSALLVQQTGKYAAIDANATTPIVGYGLADTLVNDGTITGGFAGGTLTIGGVGTFINNGTISASNGDTLVMNAMLFSNTGTIAVSGGATAILGGPPDAFDQSPAWSNTGAIELSGGGTLVLSGAVQTGQIGTIQASNGHVSLSGTLANEGATLTLGHGGLPNLSLSGTILGGTIADAGGLLTAGTSGTAVLDGVTDIGTLSLSQPGAWLRIRDGLTLNGEAAITGAGAVLGFQGNQSFGSATVLLGAAGVAATLDVLHDGAQSGPSTLTLASNLTVTQAGALADIGAAADQIGDGITNLGTIAAGVAGGTMTLGGANFTNHGQIQVSNNDTVSLAAAGFDNAGTLAVTNAALAIADSVTLGELGTLVLTNAAIGISGTLANTGTLQIGAGSAWGRVSLTGTITGGTLVDAGAGLNATGHATLNDVTYAGLLDLSRPFQQLAVTGGIDLTGVSGSGQGTILLTGAASRVLAETSETLTNATVLIGSPTQTYLGQHIAPPELAATAGATLTLGTGTVVRSAGLVGWLGDYVTGNWADTIVNEGSILAVTAGGILTLGSTFFTNAGSIAVTNDGNVLFGGADFVNAGTMTVTAGSSVMLSLLGYYEAPNGGATVFSNSGTLHMQGGVMQELTGGGLFPSVAVVNQAGGLIEGLGNVVAPVLNNGTIEGLSGPNLTIAGAITGTGTLTTNPNCVLELGNSVAASQTVDFTATGETVRIDDPQYFSAVVAGFSSGDTLAIAGTPVNTIAVTNGTLVLGTSYGQFRLDTAVPLAGEFSVGANTHAGASITYVNQKLGGGVGGGTITTIAVPEPNMLFWASPVGDIFTGTGADLNGGTISNWTTADSLDFVDFLGNQTTVVYAQATGQGTITVSDGVHTDTVRLMGSYNASWFHVTADAHGGALVTYSQS